MRNSKWDTAPLVYLLLLLLSVVPLAAGHSARAMTAAPKADPAAVASIVSGKHDCPHCQLRGADLSNQCVKHGNLEGADFGDAKLIQMCMSWADFRGANFVNADLSGANLAHALLDGADLTGASLVITSIKGTDLRHAKGVTQHQLDHACGDAQTKVSTGLKVHFCS